MEGTLFFPKKKIDDYGEYDRNNKEPRAFFGLSGNVEYCAKCVISNQRPVSAQEFTHSSKSKKSTIQFKDGICSACVFAEQKKRSIDWDHRDEQLRELCDRYRRSDGRYDCIVPGSGGKDSFFAAHVLKYKYGMNPLTITWAPNMYTPWGWYNME